MSSAASSCQLDVRTSRMSNIFHHQQSEKHCFRRLETCSAQSKQASSLPVSPSSLPGTAPLLLPQPQMPSPVPSSPPPEAWHQRQLLPHRLGQKGLPAQHWQTQRLLHLEDESLRSRPSAQWVECCQRSRSRMLRCKPGGQKQQVIPTCLRLWPRPSGTLLTGRHLSHCLRCRVSWLQEQRHAPPPVLAGIHLLKS